MASSRPRPLIRSALVLLAGLCIGALAWAAARGADGHPLSLLVLIAEPLIWAALLTVSAQAAMSGRYLRSGLALWSLLILALSLRQPTAVIAPESMPSAATPVLRQCASLAPSPSAALRVATWNTGGLSAGPLAVSVVSLGADVLILQEIGSQQALDVVVAALETELASAGVIGDAAVVEGLFLPAMPTSGMGVVVRGGWFGVCGSEERDRWSAALPAADGRVAQATLVFPKVVGVGSVPVLAAHLDRPAGPEEFLGWPSRVAGSAEVIGGFVKALDAPSVVVAGDFNTHGTFSRFNGALRGAGLRPAPTPPTWPAALGPLPALPLYQLDRVWAGPSWEVESLETVRPPHGSDHLAVIATLRPASVQAGGAR